MSTLGSRIRLFREYKGLSQEEMAEILNVSQGNITQWETDRNKPNAERLTFIQSKFPELNLEWLFANKGDMLIKTQIINNEPEWDKKYYKLLEKYTDLLERFNNLK